MRISEKMDAQYLYQRHFYDFSRKYYLIGRDALLSEIELQVDEVLLEIGCGTARNLCKLAYQYPYNRLYGVDASAAMLDVARKNLHRRKRYTGNVQIMQGLAEDVTPDMIGRRQPFDHVLFSYVLSMLPDWRLALEVALCNLAPGGYIHVVDFSDMQKMPGSFRNMLLKWLNLFNVHPDPQILPWFRNVASKHGGELQVRQTAGNYAAILHYRKSPKSEEPVIKPAAIPRFILK
ncbi:MAG: class I SAM-dependent methyltransferase [Gammaproteobacteria bacterium]|nr:class I SAM-dependent methyltransferase [Gammaproteobacteria bacterium]